MTSNNENATPLDELAHLLEVWGGEPARWPVRVRLRIATIEAAEPDAQRLLAQARAFDRVFDAGRDALARLAPDKARALTDRILAAAMATAPAPPASAPESAQVIALPIHSRERTEVVADYEIGRAHV